MGGRTKGLRLTLDVTEGKGALAALSSEIAKQNGNIITLATFSGRNATDRIITVKVTDAPQEALLKDLEDHGIKILNAVDMTEGGYTPTIIK